MAETQSKRPCNFGIMEQTVFWRVSALYIPASEAWHFQGLGPDILHLGLHPSAVFSSGRWGWSLMVNDFWQPLDWPWGVSFTEFYWPLTWAKSNLVASAFIALASIDSWLPI